MMPSVRFFPCRFFNRHGDDHGVVAGEHQVDQHNAHDGDKKFPGERNVTQPAHVDHNPSCLRCGRNKKTFTRGMVEHAVSKGLARSRRQSRCRVRVE
jgi:hypothetical protein